VLHVQAFQSEPLVGHRPLTRPSFSPSWSERVYITAPDREIGFGGTRCGGGWNAVLGASELFHGMGIIFSDIVFIIVLVLSGEWVAVFRKRAGGIGGREVFGKNDSL
jgi:hypothetical protein